MGTLLSNHRADSSRQGLVLAEAPASTFQPSNHEKMLVPAPLLVAAHPATVFHRFRPGAFAFVEPARRQGTGKVRQSAGIYLSAGDFATNDLAARRFHQLPGKRRCKREQYRRLRG